MVPGGTMSAAVIRPLQRPVPLRQSVYDALIDLIVGGDLPPGQHMVETDLARQLGVSRQPIREALHRMEAEGWVDLRPSQGAFVHVPTDSEVDELLDVRALLEAETARLAARAASSHTLPVIRTTASTTVVISALKRGPRGSISIAVPSHEPCPRSGATMR